LADDKTKRRRGRPPAPKAEQRSDRITLAIRPDIREALERRAAKSGRSISAETETWLGQALFSEGMIDQAFDLGFGYQGAGLLLLIGHVMRETGSSAGFLTKFTLEGAGNWLGNPYAFDQVVRGINEALEKIRPDGEIEPPSIGALPGSDFDLNAFYRDHLGAGFARGVLAAVIGQPRTADSAHIGKQIAERLGPAAVERLRKHLTPPPADPANG